MLFRSGTIASILKENGINPAPERDAHTRWSTFLKAHWECLTATDFLSVKVFTIKGLVTHYVLFFIDIASRSVHVAGITSHPDSSWMAQIARNITDANEGFLRGGRNLILDRDAKYTEGFRHALTREGVRLIRLPARSPNLNAFAERFVRSIKEECLSRMIFLGQASLRHAIAQYLIHYHGERNHQGLENRIPEPNFGRESGRESIGEFDSEECSATITVKLPDRIRAISGHYGTAISRAAEPRLRSHDWSNLATFNRTGLNLRGAGGAADRSSVSWRNSRSASVSSRVGLPGGMTISSVESNAGKSLGEVVRLSDLDPNGVDLLCGETAQPRDQFKGKYLI